jgi:hypothetical protein
VRALLRDVLCGYLDADLKAVADDILVDGQQPEPEPGPDREPEAYEPEPYAEIEARDLRRQRLAHEAPQAPPPRFERAPEAEQVTFEPELEYDYDPAPLYEDEFDAEPDTAEMEPVTVAPSTVAPEPMQHELDGVTPSADWGWGDPEDFSAPV